MNRRNSFALSAAAFAVCALLHLFIASNTGKSWPLITALVFSLAALLMWAAWRASDASDDQ